MRIIKCDLCKKHIKNEPVIAGIGFYSTIELCNDCGSPILKFLQKHKVVEIEKNNQIKTT